MNKLILVTGGSKGIGRAIVEKFMKEGFDAVICSRKATELRSLADHLENIYSGCRCYYHPADVSKPEEITGLLNFVAGLGRSIDVLVNNAGYFVPGTIADEPPGTLENMMQANLYSAYHVTRGILPSMKENRNGHIFNMCSVASIKAYPNGGSYAITKFALLGFSRCLREELKEWGIRVTAVLPGATRTASWDGVNLPDERFMKSEDVAEMVYAAWSLSARSVVEEILIRPQMGDI
jgi:short-subunit dehydrogenase